MHNYADPSGAEAYGRFEEVGQMPVGSRLAKDSFQAHPDGALSVGPLFIMTRLREGSSPATFDWAYRMVMPDGSVQRGEPMLFCADCHGAVAETQDSLLFLPEEHRVTPR